MTGRMTTRASRERSLAAAGFPVVRVFGDCDRRPVEPDSPELIFVAARR